MNHTSKRGLLVGRGWVQAVAIVFLLGFLILGLLAYRTYTDEPPIPAEVVDTAGNIVFTGADVIHGQEVFLRNGLMEYGTIFGHGAYLGPDFTADYLHRAALLVTDSYGGQQSDRAKQQTITDFKTNRYDAANGNLTYTAAEATAFRTLVTHYQEFFSQSTTKFGLRPKAITDPNQLRELASQGRYRRNRFAPRQRSLFQSMSLPCSLRA